ncbi:MAG TPA: GNAT family protein [Usitatibacter sp.]|jgi:RimJ/RimL family protein N-acetyltransferase|nr:GNAT family protein [Usitatibacter sp.]
MPLKPPPPLETPRLRVRPVAREDLADLLAVNGDAEVTRYLPYAPWKDATDANAWLVRMSAMQAQGTALQLVVERRDVPRVIGTCLLFRFDEPSSRVELGYVLARDHWRGGWMTEALTALLDCAFGPLELRRMEADVNPANQASQRLLERLGFEREGVRRERWMEKGTPQDSVMFGLLARDWQARTRA